MVMATTRGLNLALAVQPAIKSAADLKGKSVIAARRLTVEVWHFLTRAI
jgi:hypothetical protein